MSLRIFLDSNILVYAFSEDERRETARRILNDKFEISIQALNEFSNVASRKHKKSWETISDALAEIVGLAARVHPITLEFHNLAVRLATRYRLHIYDALHLACALKSEGDVFLSEDMQDGMVIENALTIRNPFA